ncbi:CaiB/BaiF CoA transferase family protein [Chelativorans xinjiangense]|uniref:CaiB/BaiF CoA transferase family protein n=1 Tax=Chelativorans xinjiangense TaxID=2681485 RepID=UPI00135B5523|nr:CoA transferase [Chelativorans xinjiangense]
MDALRDVRVLSFNHFLAGPAAAQILGDLGADVIAIEPLEGAFQRNWAVAGHYVDGQSVNFLSTGRNKRSVAVDLKHPDARAAVRRLIASADVVMENFRPGTMARLGFDPDALLKEHPRLIYAAATGYGSDGPYAARPGQDLLLQAMSGLAAHTGRAEGPPVAVGSVVIDHHTAALLVIGIVTALYRRERTGKGGRVEANLLQAAIDLQGEPITAWMNGAPHSSPRGPGGVAGWFSAGGYGIHATSDGHIAVSMATPADLGKALGVEALLPMSAGDGLSRREEVNRLVGEALAGQSTAEAAARLDAGGIWNAPVEDYDALPDNPQLRHLQVFRTVEGATGAPVTLVAHPVRYDGAAPDISRVPQPLGAQTREVFAEAGFSGEEITRLAAAGAIGLPPEAAAETMTRREAVAR